MNGTRHCKKEAPLTTMIRSVRFDTTRNTTHEFTKWDRKERANAWFSKDEYDNIKGSFAQILFRMETGIGDVESNECSSVGLEKQSWEGKWDCVDQRRAYYDEVLCKGKDQRKTKSHDAGKSFRTCDTITAPSKKEARDRAIEIERDISGYLNDVRLLLPKLASVDASILQGNNDKALETIIDSDMTASVCKHSILNAFKVASDKQDISFKEDRAISTKLLRKFSLNRKRWDQRSTSYESSRKSAMESHEGESSSITTPNILSTKSKSSDVLRQAQVVSSRNEGRILNKATRQTNPRCFKSRLSKAHSKKLNTVEHREQKITEMPSDSTGVACPNTKNTKATKEPNRNYESQHNEKQRLRSVKLRSSTPRVA